MLMLTHVHDFSIILSILLFFVISLMTSTRISEHVYCHPLFITVLFAFSDFLSFVSFLSLLFYFTFTIMCYCKGQTKCSRRKKVISDFQYTKKRDKNRDLISTRCPHVLYFTSLCLMSLYFYVYTHLIEGRGVIFICVLCVSYFISRFFRRGGEEEE